MSSPVKGFLPPWQLVGCAPETPVLVGLSGGADSVLLTGLLAEQAKTDGFPLTAVHVHHGIRGAEADRDAEFCRAFAERLGVAFRLVRVDAPGRAARTGESPETAARAERYRAFDAVMQEGAIPLLATAHHAQDNAETVLFRLCRGAGLGGLCGIPQVRKTGAGWVVRPLLSFTKEEILVLCRARGYAYVTDSTNLTPCCTRNVLRLEVLPALEQAVPGAARTIARTAEHLRQDADCLDGLADRWRREREQDGVLTLHGFSELHPALRGRVLAAFLGGVVEDVHLAAVTAQILSGRGGCTAIPGDRLAAVSRGTLRVWPRLRGTGLTGERPLRVETFTLCDGNLTVSARPTEKCRKSKKVHNLSTTHYIIQSDKSVIINQFFWRNLQPGDRVRVGDRMVRCADLLRAGGVPAAVREKLPVLCGVGGEICWLPFAGACGEPDGSALVLTVTLSENRTDRME